MENEITNEELARMIARGFEETATKDEIKNLESRFGNLESRFNNLESRFGGFENRLNIFEQETASNFAHVFARLRAIEKNTEELIHRDEFEDLMGRVKYLEMKLGIESGK